MSSPAARHPRHLGRFARSLVTATVILTGATAASWASAQHDEAEAAVGDLIFSDEFTGPQGGSPDQAKWAYDIGETGITNNERQIYTNSRRNSRLTGDGTLAITATRDNPDKLKCHYGTCEFTSARLKTQGKVNLPAYGRYEARIKAPRGQGLWPAFWMLGSKFTGDASWPAVGEIDIMENVGKNPNIIWGTIHGPGYSGGNSIGNSKDLGSPAADAFHTYRIDWSPNLIVWAVDGQEYHRVTPASLGGKKWVFDYPYFMILNVAVGGTFPGMPDASTQFPQTMLVDYVRVYKNQ